MPNNPVQILGLGGDSLTAPENTEIAYWAALGAGASGLAIGLRLSADGVIICSNHDDLGPTCGDDRFVSELDWDDIKRLDAGYTFRSTVLDDMNQPTGERGEDTPWLGNLPSKRAIRVPRLTDILANFSRRCLLVLLLPDNPSELLTTVLSDLRRFGVINRVVLSGSSETCAAAIAQEPGCRTMLIGAMGVTPVEQLDAAVDIGAEALYLDWTVVCPADGGQVHFDTNLKNGLKGSNTSLFLGSEILPFAATPSFFESLKGVDGVSGVIARGVLPSVHMVTPSALVLEDNFSGNKINREIWTAGYSHVNQDTSIFQDDGLQIQIKEGGTYSGAAAVATRPTHGRFDVNVTFHVENPANATTFELAAICIDPGYFKIDNSNLGGRDVNLTFDVHGAPPYASSERDEDDGFRCGWNNGFNLTQISDDWSASSGNMYNKYGRDVGDGSADSPDGRLRLVRSGQIFVSYYQDKHNTAWVCSGAMLVQNMTSDVFLRLAAKHWAKGGTPPANHVTFKDFQLYQF